MARPLPVPERRRQEAPAAPPSGRSPSRLLRAVSPRSILLALLFIPGAAYWGSVQGVDVIMSLMVPPVACTFVVAVLNALVGRFRPGRALSAGELVVFYGMVSTAVAVAAEWTGNITPLIYSYPLFANATNKFATLVLPFLPDFLFITDATPIAQIKYGGQGFFTFLRQPGPWALPVFSWTLLITLLCLAMLCINSLMREEWTDREKLSFPIIQLPLALCQGGPGFWRSRYMWGGFIVMAVIDTINGIHFMYPSVPLINVRFLGDLRDAFPSYPWNSVGWTPIGIFPFITALGVFLPTDLLFSCVFFFFFRKGQQVIAASYGHSQGVFGGGWLVPSPPYFSEQSWGAFLGLFLTAIWIARGYLREVWRDITRGSGLDPNVRSRRWALVGLVASVLGLVAMGAAAGFSAPFLILYLALFLAFSVALTRMRAQLGPPTNEMAFMGPTQLIVDFNGTQGLSHPTIARMATIFHFMNRIHRTHPMPFQLEAMKMGERTGLDQRGLFLALVIAVVAGSLCGHAARIGYAYVWGTGGAGYDTAQVVSNLVNDPRSPNSAGMLFVGLGMLFVFVLNFLRFQLPWFPFNPMGYALAMNFGVDYYWFGFLLALVIKTSVQRYSGLKGYEKLHAIALGVILGEFVIETIWALTAMVGRFATYSISINGRLGWDR
jgi:hypothetical protein